MNTRQQDRITHISIEKATKRFGGIRALSGIDLSLEKGDVVALMGANGAGKSTLLSLLSLTSRPTRGRILFNHEVPDTADVRHRIGLLSHEPMLYPDLTALENLGLFARLYGLDSWQERVGELAGAFNLSAFAEDRPVRVLSRGQRQRVALARSVLAKPDLLLLDEPAAGLDVRALARIEGMIEQHIEGGGMAVVVTHEPEVAHRVAGRAVMLKRGRVVSDGAAPRSVSGWRALYLEAVEG